MNRIGRIKEFLKVRMRCGLCFLLDMKKLKLKLNGTEHGVEDDLDS